MTGIELAAVVALGIVAIIHLAIAAFEMFFWMKPAVYGIFGFETDAQAIKAKPIVGNVGLYNLFIAAGLIWGAFGGAASFPIRVFFLVCVIVAGLFGAATLPKTKFPIPTPLLIQTVPGLLALIPAWAAGPLA